MNFLENGDFLLAIILVSVAHYTAVLHRFDWWPVAAFLGFSVDLANYRAIKLYLKDKGGALMIVTSILSLAFHIAFYVMGNAGAWGILLGSAVPIAIFCMAYIAKVERLDTKAARAATNGTRTDTNETRTDAPLTRTVDKDSFIVAYRANGHVSIAALARTMGVNVRTAQKWVAGASDKDENAGVN
jgi:DNA-binding transcriptional regulator YiaG